MSTGLRERKREMLRSAIVHNAVALALEHGYENVTVEMICERSMASPRTFFNYFGSKEAVILGPPPPAPSKQLVEAFVDQRDGDILADLARMMAAVLDQRREVDRALWRDRHEILRRTPELLRSRVEQVAAKHLEIVEIVKRRIRAQDADRGGDRTEDEVDRLARLVVGLWAGVAHCAMQLWTDHPESTSRQIMDDLLPLLATIKEL